MKIITLLLLLSTATFAQCISGDCKNGFGKYDFGFAIYEGNFMAEKPNGKGTMDYGNGEKFVGNFKNGAEDGDGILYKNNVAKNVRYTNGKMQLKTDNVVLVGNIPKIDGCVVGNCYNGFGIVKFDSGNRYEGNFVYGIKSGDGKFYFAQGNTFSGNFKDDIYTDGLFYYAKEQVSFTGNYNDDGTPKSGKYFYEKNKATVEVLNGKITKVDNPVARRADSLAVEYAKPRKCIQCSGVGMYGGGSKNVTVYHELKIRHSNGNVSFEQYANPSTRTEYTMPTQCSACNGTGQDKYPPGSIIINGGRY